MEPSPRSPQPLPADVSARGQQSGHHGFERATAGALPSPSTQTLFEDYRRSGALDPLYLLGDAKHVLKELPAESIDVVMTSPPYWGHREYSGGGLGLEKDHRKYIDGLADICAEVRRVLKRTGSLWLNLGDTYRNKQLMLIPARVAIRLIDEQGWTLRNQVIWHKVKGGPDPAKDKLRNVYEPVFHFVRQPRGYYYDVDAIRNTPKTARAVDGTVKSASGVSGARYRHQIQSSVALTEAEKAAALLGLDGMLDELAAGRLADFRMIIRGQQRTTHSDSQHVSGRARELADRGFYFILYHANGSKPADVWSITPEDTHGRTTHFAPYPAELCRLPLLATCPPTGIVLDPFVGTGTTSHVAYELGRKSVGIDTSAEYLSVARARSAAPRWQGRTT